MPSNTNEGYNMPTTEDIAEGFYRFEDLKDLGYVSSRSDLHDKQKNLNFPRPVKPSRRVAWFLKSEVHEWLLTLVNKRDAECHLETAK
jgi:predicted DNA-binding transcriptional regulator AlpA